MSKTVNIDPIFVTPDDPEYYSEILHRTFRHADRRQLFNQQSCRNIPTIQNVDDELSERLRILLDVLADILIYQRGNASATMASLIHDGGSSKTRLYIIFNREDDAAGSCRGHLETIFDMLRKVPYTPTDKGYPKLIPKTLWDDLNRICQVIHDHSFDIFWHRVNKHRDKLLEIWRYIEEDETQFSPNQRSTLLQFLWQVEEIILQVDEAKDIKQLPTIGIEMLQTAYSHWTSNNLLAKDDPADSRPTLLDMADDWLGRKHHIRFHLRSWAEKIMSLLIAANRLFTLTQSSRFRGLLDGQFEVVVLPSPTTTPYYCSLSSETIQVALDAALAEATGVPNGWDDGRKSFMRSLEKQEASAVVTHETPTVHAELAMIMAMDEGKVRNVFPYIGISKLSCTMCTHYIDAFNEATNQQITTKGSHGKVCPGWFWPFLPNHDRKLRPAFIKRMRKQLLNDFEVYVRQTSHSSVGSGLPELEPNEEMDKMFDVMERRRLKHQSHSRLSRLSRLVL